MEKVTLVGRLLNLQYYAIIVQRPSRERGVPAWVERALSKQQSSLAGPTMTKGPGVSSSDDTAVRTTDDGRINSEKQVSGFSTLQSRRDSED